MLTAKLKLEIDGAHKIAKIINPDDTPWAKCWAEEGKLIIFAESTSTGAVLNALDDYMLNIKAALSLIDIFNHDLDLDVALD